MKKEIWKDILGYEGLYQVSNLGNIKSIYYKNGKEKYLKPLMVNGYFQVVLSKNKKVKHFYIHRLVCLTFLDNPNNKLYVNHIDGNGFNNNLNNLEWCSASENNLHKFKF